MKIGRNPQFKCMNFVYSHHRKSSKQSRNVNERNLFWLPWQCFRSSLNFDVSFESTLTAVFVSIIFSGKQFHQALELFASFKRGLCGGVKVRLGRLQVSAVVHRHNLFKSLVCLCAHLQILIVVQTKTTIERLDLRMCTRRWTPSWPVLKLTHEGVLCLLYLTS